MTKKAVKEFIKCKVKGMCDRDKEVTRYIAARVDNFERRLQTFNEQYREEHDLPRCPPNCEVIEHE